MDGITSIGLLVPTAGTEGKGTKNESLSLECGAGTRPVLLNDQLVVGLGLSL